MTTAQQAYNWLAKYLNRRDNNGAFMWQLAGAPNYTGSAWCGATVWATLKNSGAGHGPLTLASTIYVPSAVNVARANGLWTTSYHAGLMWPVMFDWNRDGSGDHIGFIVSQNPSQNYVHTIEGNTSDANGNGPRGVFLRTRLRSDILGVMNPKGFYTATPPKAPAKKPAVPAGQLKVDGLLGPNTIRAWQKQCGTTADGKITAGGSQLVVFQQKYLNAKGITDERGKKLVVDGICDMDNTAHATPKQHTIAALQKYWGTPVDGVFSHPSAAVEELQRRLNKLAK